MPKIPTWIPRNPGCGCLVILAIALAALLLMGDAR